jgi:hypothetical protein
MTHVLSCIARWISKRNDGARHPERLNEGPTQTSGVLGYRDIRMIEHALDSHSGRLTVIGAVRRFSLHCRRRSRWPSLGDLVLDGMLTGCVYGRPG